MLELGLLLTLAVIAGVLGLFLVVRAEKLGSASTDRDRHRGTVDKPTEDVS